MELASVLQDAAHSGIKTVMLYSAVSRENRLWRGVVDATEDAGSVETRDGDGDSADDDSSEEDGGSDKSEHSDKSNRKNTDNRKIRNSGRTEVNGSDKKGWDRGRVGGVGRIEKAANVRVRKDARDDHDGGNN